MCDKSSETSQARKRGASSSSSEENEDSSRESSPERHSKVSKRSRQTVSDMQFQFLAQQVAFLTTLITQNKDNENRSSASVSENIRENATETVLTEELTLRPPPMVSNNDNNRPQLQLSELSTNIKEPVYIKASELHLSKLTKIQRFNCSDWNALRFYEHQKKYVATPGFIELGINDELRRLGSSASSEESRLYLLERSFAALSNALISQKEELKASLQQIVDWSSDNSSTLTSRSLFDKIESSFNKDSSYSKVTDDILQIVCGRRADCIQSRREILLKQIPEQFHCGALQKIPPSSEFLFDEHLLTTYLQKIGGAEKLTINPQAYHRSSLINPRPSTSYGSNFKSGLNRQGTEKFFRCNNASIKGKGRGKTSSGKANYNRNRTSLNEQKGKKSTYNSSNTNNKP